MSEEKRPATPAPLADAELAELVRLDSVATPAPWRTASMTGAASRVVDMGPRKEPKAPFAVFHGDDAPQIENAALTAAMRNALPGLLARLAAAEARLAALDKAYEVANSYDDNVDGYPHSWAAIKYGFDNAPTVKGGQPHA